MTTMDELTPVEALRKICQSSHCVSESLREDLKPYEVTKLKTIVYNALIQHDEFLLDVKKYFALQHSYDITGSETIDQFHERLDLLAKILMVVSK